MICINCSCACDKRGAQSVCLKKKNFPIYEAYRLQECDMKEEVQSCCTCNFVLKKDFGEFTQYCCTLQNGKVMKEMSNIDFDFSNFPPCSIGLYEHR